MSSAIAPIHEPNPLNSMEIDGKIEVSSKSQFAELEGYLEKFSKIPPKKVDISLRRDSRGSPNSGRMVIALIVNLLRYGHEIFITDLDIDSWDNESLDFYRSEPFGVVLGILIESQNRAQLVDRSGKSFPYQVMPEVRFRVDRNGGVVEKMDDWWKSITIHSYDPKFPIPRIFAKALFDIDIWTEKFALLRGYINPKGSKIAGSSMKMLHGIPRSRQNPKILG